MIIWVGIHKILVTNLKENLNVDGRIFLKWVTKGTWSQLVGLG